MHLNINTLNYHSVGYLTMYYFGRCLSFEHIKMHKLTNSQFNFNLIHDRPLFVELIFPLQFLHKPSLGNRRDV